MRPVYAVQFQVASPSGNDPFDTVATEIERWVAAWYTRWKAVDLPSPIVAKLTPADDHVIDVEDRSVDKVRLWSLVWSYPPQYDERLLWHVTATLARSDGRTEASIVLRVGSREFTIAPPEFDLRRPHIVRTLVDKFVCTLGERVLRGGTQPLGVPDVETFTALLRSSERRLPIVLFSREPYSDRFLASPSKVADALVGLAEVFVLNDKWTSFRLTTAIGKPYSCFNGAARLYWPGMDARGELRADRPFMPNEVEELGDDLIDRLVRRIAPVSGLRFVEMPTTRTARAAIEEDRAAKLREMAQRAERREDDSVDWLLRENQELRVQKQRADGDRDDAQLRVLELQEEVARLSDNVHALTAYSGASPPSGSQSGPAASDPTTVREALDRAATDFATRLAVWSSGEDSADACDFGRPAEVYEALMAIAEVSERYFSSREKGGTPVGRWEVLFEQMGIKYAPFESPTTMGRYGKDRDFTSSGKTRRIEKHLTIGGGDKKNCAQIYFDVDEDSSRFVVVYCGRHLPTDKYH